MTYRTLGIIFLLVTICAACYGQTSFQGLTPGASTRNDVVKVLGQPVHTISEIRFEYKPPPGTAKIEVEYSESSVFAEQIEVYLLRPVTRSAMIETLKMTPSETNQQLTFNQAPAWENSATIESVLRAPGKLMEYFPSKSLKFTYATADKSSGVSQIGYYSKHLFGRALRILQRKADVPALNANVTSLVFFSDDAQETAEKNEDKRVYLTRFSQAETAYVRFVIYLEHPAPGRRIQIAFGSKWYDPKGILVSDNTSELYVPAKQVDSGFTEAYGSNKPGALKVGIYRVEILFNGQMVATGSFEVY